MRTGRCSELRNARQSRAEERATMASKEPNENAMRLEAYIAPRSPHEATDIARLRVAVERLRAAGYVVVDGGCCPSCNWRQIRDEYPDADNVVQFNDQCLDAAFGE